MTSTATDTVTISGVTYEIDRSVYEDMSTVTVLCGLTGPRGGYAQVARDKIAHGAYIAMGHTALERLSSPALRAAIEPLFPASGFDADDRCVACRQHISDPCDVDCPRACAVAEAAE